MWSLTTTSDTLRACRVARAGRKAELLFRKPRTWCPQIFHAGEAHSWLGVTTGTKQPLPAGRLGVLVQDLSGSEPGSHSVPALHISPPSTNIRHLSRQCPDPHSNYPFRAAEVPESLIKRLGRHHLLAVARRASYCCHCQKALVSPSRMLAVTLLLTSVVVGGAFAQSSATDFITSLAPEPTYCTRVASCRPPH